MSHCRCPGVTASLVDQRAAPEMPRLKNCCACDISSGSRGGSRTSKGPGGGTTSVKGASFLGGSGGMLVQKFLSL